MTSKKQKIKTNLIVLAISIPMFFFGGFVDMKLWNWFVPAITGLRAIGFVEALGIDTVITYFTARSLKSEIEEGKEYETLIKAATNTFIYLALGFIIHLFM